MLQKNRNSFAVNEEGYPDPTAAEVISTDAREHKVNFLIKIIKYVIRESGFILVNRIELQDKETGRIYR